MRVTDFSKPITAKTLNENLAQKFGQRINLETFTLEQLQDARNKIRTRIATVEANENFNETSSADYTKNKLFLDVLNAEIAEREDVAVADTIKEGAEENAALVMAAKDMVDRVTGWMEDTAEMQTESMLELGDKIRDEVGSEQSEAFIGAVKPALESLFAALESTRDSLTGGVAVLTGEGAPETMGAEDPAVEDPAMEPTVDQEAEAGAVEEPAGDEFDAAGAAAGGEAEAGREQRESIEKSRKLGQLLVGSKKKS